MKKNICFWGPVPAFVRLVLGIGSWVPGIVFWVSVIVFWVSQGPGSLKPAYLPIFPVCGAVIGLKLNRLEGCVGPRRESVNLPGIQELKP